MLGKKLLGASAKDEALDISDVFSIDTYVGNANAVTITNGIDLAGQGGMVWVKATSATQDHFFFDTERPGYYISSPSADAQVYSAGIRCLFNSDGYQLAGGLSSLGTSYVAFAFRKAPKFFDVVKYTGTGAARTIPHNLGCKPGMIIVKHLGLTMNYKVYHGGSSSPETNYLELNTNKFSNGTTSYWNSTAPTDTHFSIGANTHVNEGGKQFIAYIFADALDGFGVGESESIIKVGYYTGNGSTEGPEVNIGWEPEFLMIKNCNTSSNWIVADQIRGMAIGSSQGYLTAANETSADTSHTNYLIPQPSGFKVSTSSTIVNTGTNRYAYMAIRTGQVKPPTTGAEVFATETQGETLPNPPAYQGVRTDLAFFRSTNISTNTLWGSRRSGTMAHYVNTNQTPGGVSVLKWNYNDGFYNLASVSANDRAWMFKEAPGFFNSVSYKGNSATGRVLFHEFGVVPEFTIIKEVGASTAAGCWFKHLPYTEGVILFNPSASGGASSYGFYTADPTSTTLTIGSIGNVNGSSSQYIAYLFATLPGVSKVGSYTGNGSTNEINIDCGFTAGARFVLIKRTDATGGWYVYDHAMGITESASKFILLDSTGIPNGYFAYIKPYAPGFRISTTASSPLNINGATYGYLAIS